jgi:hypothetical protein
MPDMDARSENSSRSVECESGVQISICTVFPEGGITADRVPWQSASGGGGAFYRSQLFLERVGMFGNRTRWSRSCRIEWVLITPLMSNLGTIVPWIWDVHPEN